MTEKKGDRKKRSGLAALTSIILIGMATTAQAQLPATRLGSIFPSGANPGTKVEVTLTGEDLDDVTALRCAHPGITATQKMVGPGPFDKGPVPVPNRFELTIPANIPFGMYDIRAVGKYGISNPRAFTVGDLPEAVEVEPNDKRETATELNLPCVVNGQADRLTDVDWFQITAAAGQRLLIDCRARRIDSLMDPVVSVFDATGRELDSSRDSQAGDPLLDFTVPAAGAYFVRVHDALFRGNDARFSYFYRLSVGVLTKIDFVFPPAGLAGSSGPFTLFGRNLPGGQPTGLMVQGKPLQKLDVAIPIAAPAAGPMVSFSSRIEPELAGLDGVEFSLKGAQNLSNSVFVGVATAPVVLEVEPNSRAEAPQKLVVPCEVAGQFYPQRDDDWFAFDAKMGDVYSIEVISQRLGAETDPTLLVQQLTTDADGKLFVFERASVDDASVPDAGAAFDIRSDDPAFRFVAPADGTYRLLVRDTSSGFQPDPRAVYRLAIRREQPDFRLAAAPVTTSGGLFLRKGGSEAVQVAVWRRDGFAGEITVTATGLPPGVVCPPIIIGPTRTCAQLVLTAADNAAPANSLMQISGKALVGGVEVTRPVRAGTLIWPMIARQNNQQLLTSGESRLCSDIAVSVSEAETSSVLLTAGQDKVWETARGGILKIPYAIVRRGDFKADVVVIARDLPANLPAPVVNVNGATAAGEYELKLTATTAVGTYTFFLDGFAQAVPYARNPEAAKIAADRKVEIDKFNTDAIAAAKVATDAKTAADKVAVDAAAAVKTAETAKAAADKVAADMATVLKTATDKAAQAKAAAAANATDANLAAAVVAADKAVTDATAALKTAGDTVIASQKKLEEGLGVAKSANEAKEKADRAQEAAVAFAKLAAEAKVQADQTATVTANAAKPTNRLVFVPSTPVTLKVTEAPLMLTATAPAAPLKQGAMVEVPVNITRLYAYADAVNLSVVLPQGVGGLSIPGATIAAGQTASKFIITAAANATEGKHELIVRATFGFNGNGLTVDVPLTLTVEKVTAQ